MTITSALFGEFPEHWLMEPGERMAFIGLLSGLRPRLAIEIGTCLGGSLAVISKFASEIYSLDISPEVAENLRDRFPGVHFLTGDSGKLFPELLARLASEGETPDFVLIDGDHSEYGVRLDILPLLDVRPLAPLYVVLHDSFNPVVRRAIGAIPWNDSPYFQSLEMDFVPGTMFEGRHDCCHPVLTDGDVRRSMFNGLAVALFSPEPRSAGEKGPIVVRQQLVFNACLPASVHKVDILINWREKVRAHPLGKYVVAVKRFFYKGNLRRA